jgi:nitrogen fixation protein NifB
VSDQTIHSIFCIAGNAVMRPTSSAPTPEHCADAHHNHPCFSEDAHHYYARLHVAVAPACNIQCHYCHRKYDCSNESRPGVVSELLTPQQALAKTFAVSDALPQLAVVGIAGPGDPLANPERTFATLALLAQHAPDLKLCISTNGLALPGTAARLKEYGVDHVTITINSIDPDIGAQIHPWIFWQHRRLRGVQAARRLIAQQLQGLEELVALGITVKINSVLIPGINDDHLPTVSQAVKERGAWVHNVMPLIAAPEHGTVYGLTGQRAPSDVELNRVRSQCSQSMPMMSHCQQCRADAVGLLGEDRGQEFSLQQINTMTLDPIALQQRRAAAHAEIERTRLAAQQQRQTSSNTASKQNVAYVALPQIPPATKAPRPAMQIAVASHTGQRIDSHFGQATHFFIYSVTDQQCHCVAVRTVPQYCHGPQSCTELTNQSRFQAIQDIISDCCAVLCSQIGYEPWQQLEQAGIQPNNDYALMPIEEAVTDYYNHNVLNGLSQECLSLSA